MQVLARPRGQVAGATREGLAVERGIAQKHEAGAVEDVEPLVRVHDERVCPLESAYQVARGFPEAEEGAEGSVDVQPEPVLRADVGDRCDRSQAPVLTEPAWAITIAGATPAARSRSIASTSGATCIR